MEKSETSYADFAKLALHIGTIIKASVNEDARIPAYILEIDFGKNIGIRKSSAQITDNYSAQELIGKQVMAVTNFPPKQVARTMSTVLVLGAIEKNNTVVLLSPDKPVENGLEIA